MGRRSMGGASTFDLHGMQAVVTGGAQGIGRAVAERILDSGATVTIWDTDEKELHAAIEGLSARARESASTSADAETVRVFGTLVDVTDEDSVSAAAAALGGKTDILVCSAGISGMNAPSWEYPTAEFKKVVDIDLTGVFLCNKAVLPGMVERNYGRIVNVASIAGKEGNPNAVAYSAAKAGVIALTKSISKETAQFDISVNCITPAAAKTRIFDQMKEEHIQYMLSKIPRGRFLQLDEVASMVTWLVTKENSFTTGSAFDLSGGRATY